MTQNKYSRLKFGIVLGAGALIAAVLCFQCVRTYLYIGAVLIPQQAAYEAEQQAAALTGAARSAAISDPRKLSPVMAHALESSSGRVLWMRLLTADNEILARGGKPEGAAKVPPRWLERLEKHEKLGVLTNTAQGKALVTMLPFRLPQPPPRSFESPGPPPGHHGTPYLIEVAVPLESVAGEFNELGQNLIMGLIAAGALLTSLTVIGWRAPYYFRGQHLESEMKLAKRVQNDLLPKASFASPYVEFSASSVAAGHVGGDFYDIFETASSKIALVLGDVSGKGMPAALLVSVLQGAIRSSTAAFHEYACGQINKMLCERTACERFATLFWGVFDPTTGTLRYVNAGHDAPMLIRQADNSIERLAEGGLVLGLLPRATYTAGVVRIQSGDQLILCSDGINEAANRHEEEFGEDRLVRLVSAGERTSPAQLCMRIMDEVTKFATAGVPADDRTLMVIRFGQPVAESSALQHEEGCVEAFA